MKFKYIVVYENYWDKFDIWHFQTPLQNFSSFPTIQTVKSHNSTLIQARKFILSLYVHLLLIYKIYEYRHAWWFIDSLRVLNVDSVNSISQL